MSKGMDLKKSSKKEPAKTQKEKKADKKLKKDEKKGVNVIHLSAGSHA